MFQFCAGLQVVLHTSRNHAHARARSGDTPRGQSIQVISSPVSHFGCFARPPRPSTARLCSVYLKTLGKTLPKIIFPPNTQNVQRQTLDKATGNTFPPGTECRGEASCSWPEHFPPCPSPSAKHTTPRCCQPPGSSHSPPHLNGPATSQASMKHKQEDRLWSLLDFYFFFWLVQHICIQMSTGCAQERERFHTCCPTHLHALLLLHTQTWKVEDPSLFPLKSAF